MADYISREPMIREIQQLYEGVPYNFPNSTYTEWETMRGKYAAFIDYLKHQPAADVQPVKRGKWEEVNEYGGWGDTYYRCSVCGDEWDLDIGTPAENGMKYCPNCGADMTGGKQ